MRAAAENAMKPLLFGGALLLAGLGTAGALYVAPLGGEEEVSHEAQETAGPSASPSEPEGWVRFSHPGTAEAPPFSFAYPGEWHVSEPQVVLVDPPSGEPGGMAVRVEVFSYDPSRHPVYTASPGGTPGPPIPPDSMYLNVFVGPYAPLEDCGPYDAGEPDTLSGFEARRLVDLQGPNATWEAAVVYAITGDANAPDDCYSIETSFSLEGEYQEIFDQFVKSFRVGA
jgi:hypothetical protein